VRLQNQMLQASLAAVVETMVGNRHSSLQGFQFNNG
jgi:hypothetical protein